MTLLLITLTALGIPIGDHSGETLYTDLTGNVLLLGTELLSAEPGSGRNPLSTANGLCWKECPRGEEQRVVSETGNVLFSAPFFSGPFPAPPGAEFMVAVPGEILLIDWQGDVLERLCTGEFPGSLTWGQGFIWYVSSKEGLLFRMDAPTGSKQPVELPFTPVTISFLSGRFLIGRAGGGYLVTDGSFTELYAIEEGFAASLLPGGSMSWCRWSQSDGCEAVAWETALLTANGTLLTFPLDTEPRAAAAGDLTDDPVIHFDVPAIYQRWDTPDWFNGSWSCGPTSCLMGVQYYNRLTPDSIWVSSPYGHWSSWGSYIPVEYTFLGYTYDIMGLAAGNVWVPGAHGFICREYGGAGWNEMTWWLEQHGLDSSWLGTTWSACTGELNGLHPVVASTTSPLTGGHILIFNGWYANHSVVCNDAYGNQNEPGWGTMMNGKDVVYDWPGYNNGNIQLGVSQLFSAVSEPLTPAGTLIDDRSLGYEKLGPCQYWHEQGTGYGGYSWWTYSTGALPDTCIVRWNPELPQPGIYLVETYVPGSHATATGIYTITTQSGPQTVSLDQGGFSAEWAPLGSFTMNPSTARVQMGDYTGTQGQHISFDAVRFTLQSSIEEEASGIISHRLSASPNPVSPGSQLVFTLPGADHTVLVFDGAGRLVAETNGDLDTSGLAPGVYHAAVQEVSGIEPTRFTVLPD